MTCACDHALDQHGLMGRCSATTPVQQCVCRHFRRPLVPLRRVVDRFEDWRGKQEELECGHILQKSSRAARRCVPCLKTGKGGEVVALHDIRCGCYRCTERKARP